MQLTKRQQIKIAMQPIIAKWIKQYRISSGLTQAQMARQYGMAARSYIDLEHGTSFPSAVTLAQLLTALGKDDVKRMMEETRAAVEPIYTDSII